MKKIQLITSFFESPFYPDRAPYNEQLFLKLAPYYDITIVRPIAWTENRAFRNAPRYKNYYQKNWSGIQVFYPTFWYIPKIFIRLRAWCYRMSISKTLKLINQTPDIYYTTWAYPDAYATMCIARKKGCPYILRVHGSDINVLGEMLTIKKRVKEVIENAALVIAPSQALKIRMVELGIDTSRVKVVYSGVDENKFAPEDPIECCSTLKILSDGVPKLLYIGNLKRSKGVIDLVLAASKLVQSGKNFKLFVIGVGADRAKLKQVITDNNLQSYVQLVGKVPHDRLGKWINACDVLCLPSYGEGMPNVILEGLACRTKIVATRVGGIPEAIVEHQQSLVEPGDINALSEALSRSLFDDRFTTTSAIQIKSYTQIANEIKEYIEALI